MARVLITDGNLRKALAAARSLGAAGWEVWVSEETVWQMTRFSRYVARALRSPPPAQVNRYAAWLVETATRHGVDLVLPMDDNSTAAAVLAAPQLGHRVLVPTPDQWQVARDKARTLELAQRAGVPVPPGRAVSNLKEAQAIAREVGFPLVVRSRQESGGRGLAFIDTPEGLPAAFAQVQRRDPTPLVQRRVPPGEAWCVGLLYDGHSQVRAHYVQRLLRRFPVQGGPGTLQESAHRPDLVELATRLLRPLGWSGPVEVEFLEDPVTGQVWLMEINPRFWASLALAIQCGVDFPALAAALSQGGEPPPVRSYAAGQRCRWLWPGDILHYLSNPRRAAMEPSFWHTYDHRTRDDTWSRDDPGPLLGFFVAALRQSFSLRAWRMLLRW